jgi:hypothetical protein
MADVWTPSGPAGIISVDVRQELSRAPVRSKEKGGLTKKMAGQVVAQGEVVSGAEVGRRLGVSRERVRQWATDPKYGFPTSLGWVGGAKVWQWLEVVEWAERRQLTLKEGRTGP